MSRREDVWDCVRTERSHDNKVRWRDYLGRLERRLLFQDRLQSRFRVRILLLDHSSECDRVRLGLAAGQLTG
jgi:hypothetical protein